MSKKKVAGASSSRKITAASSSRTQQREQDAPATMNTALVPKLRFPEFRDAGEWVETTLGKCLSRRPEYGINAPAVAYAANLPTYLRITDISDDGQIRQDQKVSVAKDITDENYLEEGDIVLARTGASVGKSYKYRTNDGRLVFAGFLIRVRPDKQKLNVEFLFQFLCTEKYWRWVDFSSTRSGQPGINGNEYASLPLTLPPCIEEQQKIADCLSSLDGLIAAESEKLDALKTHKKGLMQRLFPKVAGASSSSEIREQDAPTTMVPRLRFPEFRNAGEWEEKKLSQVCEVNPSVSTLPEAFVYIDLESVEGGKLFQKKIIPREGAPSRAQRLLKRGDVIFQTVRPYQKNNYFFMPDDDLDYVASTGYAQLRAHESSKYLFQYLHNDRFVGRVLEKCTGSNYPAINSSDLSAILVEVPKPDEQQKIADCLSSLDGLIAAQSEKIDALKTHKKGLMQQLFPAVEAV